jgi:hypothetical protein
MSKAKKTKKSIEGRVARSTVAPHTAMAPARPERTRAAAPAGATGGGTPPPEAHDLLLIPPLVPENERLANGAPKMLRMAIQADGSYGPSEWLDFDQLGARKVYNIARPTLSDPDPTPRGPGFAVLPIRPDPGSQYETCYLINTENLQMPSPWSAADWDAVDDNRGNAPSRAPATASNPAAGPAPSAFEVLLAGPGGKVFHVQCDEGGNVTGTPVDLGVEPEIWAQLREGVVVGSVRYAKNDRIMPIVNVTSVKVKKGAQ